MSDARNCPFYGRHLIVWEGLGPRRPTPSHLTLVGQGGNQCAFVINRYAPCEMEIHGLAPDWPTCPLLLENTTRAPEAQKGGTPHA
jgi:hypothetical protein